LTCHSQLYTDQPALQLLVTAFRSGVPPHWERVNKLLDFVQFNPSIHIAPGQVPVVRCLERLPRQNTTIAS
jgi:hypothetical protein